MTSSTRPSGCAAIERAFQAARAANRCALITFLTLGYPSPAESPELVLALARGGADLIELGVPFSDPVADGPAIQESSFRALEAGMTPTRGFEMVRQLRAAGIDKPLLLMGYYNPLLSYGLEAYVSDCVAVGVDGLIVPDLPPEEAEPLESLCRAAGLALVFLVTPTSDEARVTQVAQRTTGFLYVVSQLGTTGGDLHDETALASRLAGVRDRARTPVAVGFGVSRPEQVRQLAPQVDGVIVGSAVVRKSAEGPGALQTYVRSLREATARGQLLCRQTNTQHVATPEWSSAFYSQPIHLPLLGAALAAGLLGWLLSAGRERHVEQGCILGRGSAGKRDRDEWDSLDRVAKLGLNST